MNLRFFCACCVVAAAVLAPAALGQGGKSAPPAPSMAVAYRGGLVTPPIPKPRITLSDTSGAPFDFWAKTQGQVTLLFFGYTYCPDQCPIHMANIATGLKALPPGLTDQIKLVFVTTDPARDTPKVLRSWLDHFDKRFIGLTGSQSAIEAIQQAVGVDPARKAGRLPNGDYAVGHANFVLAYSKDNLAHLIYPGGITEQDWAHDLPQLVKESWSNR